MGRPGPLDVTSAQMLYSGPCKGTRRVANHRQFSAATRSPRSPSTLVTIYDNVTAQRRLLADGLGIMNLRLVAGYSMGALEAYHWATLYPDAVRAIVPIAGSARTGLFNKVFLAGIRSAIMSDPDWNNGFYGDAPPIRGLRQFARIYAGWGFSEPFYRQQFKTAFGASSLEDFIETF
jgi:homoserine O-acetyltransferase/O-succinyltransferase